MFQTGVQVCLLFTLAHLRGVQLATQVLRIFGLFEMSGYYEERGNAQHRVNSFFWAQKRHKFFALLGPGCAEAAGELAYIVKQYNLIQVSFSNTEVSLSDRSTFSTFFRTVAPETVHNTARQEFIQSNSWTNVCFLTQEWRSSALALNDLADRLKNIIRSFSSPEALKDVLRRFKIRGCRIIVASYDKALRSELFCEALAADLVGERNLWIVYENYQQDRMHFEKTDWLKICPNCSMSMCNATDLARALDGNFFVSPLDKPSFLRRRDELYLLGKPILDYETWDIANSKLPFVREAFDAALSIADALRRVLNNTQQTVVDVDSWEFRHQLLLAMQGVNIQGLSGPVSYDGPDRRIRTQFLQMQGGRPRPVALYDPENGSLQYDCAGCWPIVWKGGVKPLSAPLGEFVRIGASPVAIVVISAMACLALVMASGFLTFNIRYRNSKQLKLSSPPLNSLVIVGCMLVYLGIVMLGIVQSEIASDDTLYCVLCMAHVFCFAAGFSTAFGCLFAKTFRIHFIYKRASLIAPGAIKSRLLKDKPLMLFVLFLVMLDGCIIFSWALIDPFRKATSYLPPEYDVSRDVLVTYQIFFCYSEYNKVWTGIFFAFKGFMLVIGAYLAWEVRHVKITALNESTYIAASIYSVALLSVVACAVYFLLRDRPTLVYSLSASLILLFTSTAMCLLIVPKMHAVWFKAHKEDINFAASSSLLFTRGKTRRLNTGNDFDDKVLRAEIQNRVFKRDLVRLDEEICELEKTVEMIQHLGPSPFRTRSEMDRALSEMSETGVDGRTSSGSFRNRIRSSVVSFLHAPDMPMALLSRRHSRDAGERTTRTGIESDVFPIEEAKALLVKQSLAFFGRAFQLPLSDLRTSRERELDTLREVSTPVATSTNESVPEITIELASDELENTTATPQSSTTESFAHSLLSDVNYLRVGEGGGMKRHHSAHQKKVIERAQVHRATSERRNEMKSKKELNL